MNDLICCDEGGSVTKSELLARLDQFATLATRLDSLGVTSISLDGHVCHASHAEIISMSANYQESKVCEGNRACLQWLSCVMEKGHLEISQPLIGEVIGWPQRKVTKNSLWIDFCSWCRKQEITKAEMPEQWGFYDLLDQLFIRKDDKYELPSLEDCRKTFDILRQQYECD